MDLTTKNIRYRRNLLGKVEAYDEDTGAVVGVEESLNKWTPPDPSLPPVVYSPRIADLQQGMPSKSTVLRWCDKYPEFNDRLERARRSLAISLHDEVIAAARDIQAGGLSKGELESKKVAADLMKWGAEKNDQERYGSRKAELGQGNVTIVIQTGIDRGPIIEVVDERFKEGGGAGSGFGGQLVRGSGEVAQEGGIAEAGVEGPGAYVDLGEKKQEEA
jgi:hypothetical protein